MVAGARRGTARRRCRRPLAGADPRRLMSLSSKGALVTGSGEVLLEVDGGVAVVTLNAPDRRNALTPAMASELIATFDEVDGRADVGALVVRAVGKSFCAGGDIKTLTDAGRDPAEASNYEGMSAIYDSFY